MSHCRSFDRAFLYYYMYNSIDGRIVGLCKSQFVYISIALSVHTKVYCVWLSDVRVTLLFFFHSSFYYYCESQKPRENNVHAKRSMAVTRKSMMVISEMYSTKRCTTHDERPVKRENSIDWCVECKTKRSNKNLQSN